MSLYYGDCGGAPCFRPSRTEKIALLLIILGAGAAGIFLEDQVWPKRCAHMKGKQVIALDEQLLITMPTASAARRKKDRSGYLQPFIAALPKRTPYHAADYRRTLNALVEKNFWDEIKSLSAKRATVP